jgi:hypothetical protein
MLSTEMKKIRLVTVYTRAASDYRSEHQGRSPLSSVNSGACSFVRAEDPHHETEQSCVHTATHGSFSWPNMHTASKDHITQVPGGCNLTDNVKQWCSLFGVRSYIQALE